MAPMFDPVRISREVGRPLKRRVMTILAAAVIAVTGCQNGSGSEDARVIYTTSPVFATIVSQIAGEYYEVRNLLPAGSSPHAFEPRPSDVRAVTQARLLIYGAPNLDEWVTRIPDVPRTSLMSHLPDSMALPYGAETPNPHFWVDPLAVKEVIGPLAKLLCALDETVCDEIRRNAVTMQNGLDSLFLRLDSELTGLRSSGLIVSHPFLDYFSARFGLQSVNIVEGSGNLEPSARELARLIESVAHAEYVAVVTERSEPSSAARTVAEATGLPLVSVDPLGGRNGENSYESIVSDLASALVEISHE